jgi:hypothetical protein
MDAEADGSENRLYPGAERHFRSRVSADGSQVQVFRFGYGFRI